jgi:hypothetical protein
MTARAVTVGEALTAMGCVLRLVAVVLAIAAMRQRRGRGS